MKIECYTDGSCYHKTRLGAWFFVVVDRDTESILYERGSTKGDTTVNQMETNAIVAAMKYVLKNKLDAVIYSDSRIGIKWAKDYIPGFPVNRVSWVRGHAGYTWNEYADKNAKRLYKSIRNTINTES